MRRRKDHALPAFAACPAAEFALSVRLIVYGKTTLDTEPAASLLLRFWPLQCMGWLGLALATFPLKLYVFGNIGDALEVTLMREGLGFAITCGIREIWRRHWSRVERRPLRQLALIFSFAILAALVDIAVIAAFGHRLSPEVMQDASFRTISFSYRVLIFAFWGLLYFAIKGVMVRRRMAAAIREAELRMLRTQISPHFFFNALNTMLACSKKNTEALPPLIHSLANYLRYTLKHHDSELVPLREEYDAVLAYLAVEKARFRDDLQFDASIEPAAEQQPVPGILLQPLLENAVKHGRATSPRPLHIVIAISLPEPKVIEIRVTNTGRWQQTQPPLGFGIGLKNLRHRLQLAYPEHNALSVTEADGRVSVCIRLPVAAE